MSRETQEWLSRYTLIGFTDKRGNAWHWRRGDNNHFPGAIPLEEVRRRLFFWKPLEANVQATIPGRPDAPALVDPTRKAIVRPRTAQFGDPQILGIHSTNYRVHDFEEWLITNIGQITDTAASDLEIGSAGLLRDGAQAWVQIELPESVTTAEGVEYRPFIAGATSLDGSMATTFKTGNMLIVCDNTLHSAMRSADGRIKIRHTSRSLTRINDVRQALDLVFTESEAFEREVAELTSIKVSDADWQRFLELHVPLDDDAKKATITRTQNKRDKLTRLFRNDERSATWTGTAWGALQAVNTFNQHDATVKGAERAERAQLRFLSGEVDRDDATALDQLFAAVN